MIFIPYVVTTAEAFQKELRERIIENESLLYRSFRFQYCLEDNELKQLNALIDYLDETLKHFKDLVLIVDEGSLSFPEVNKEIEKEYNKTLLQYLKVINNADLNLNGLVRKYLITSYYTLLSKCFDYEMLYPVKRGGVYSSDTLKELQESYYRLFQLISTHKEILNTKDANSTRLVQLDECEKLFDKLNGEIEIEYKKIRTLALDAPLEGLTLFKGIYRMIKLKKIIKKNYLVIFTLFN